MPDSSSIENKFLRQVTEIIEKNISSEQFGVSELADETGMSRSNLLRKVKKLTNISVSQFIRNVRLQHAKEMLRQESVTVSEVSYNVGFSSPSYFIKCFREYYGYPPGEVGKSEIFETEPKKTEKSSHAHQLAAIMFTDIEGYTALMQRDEATAVEFRNRHREVFNNTIKKFNGKILQYYGDGTLSTFPSAIDAVYCGIEMQKAFREEPKIPVRIGIHSGDIIFTEDDIIGDGVNVASRIESLSVVGSVFISEKVYDEVKNQTGISTSSMGTFELKNVGRPLEVFAIANQGLTVPKREQIVGKLENESSADKKELRQKKKWAKIKWALIALAIIIGGYFVFTSNILDSNKQETVVDQTITKKSIAVLPFINDSNDSTNVYIINGLMESILTNLQKIDGLRVISRTSVEKYRNSQKQIPEIAKELNVKYFIEGSGQKIGDQILLHIQLIEAPNDKHLWSEQYQRDAKDIFTLQLDVAKNIAEKIEVIITPEEEERINKIPTDNLVAYDYFLKGLDLFHKGNAEGLVESITWFRKAIEHDNKFARAYADIAMAYYFLDIFQADKKFTDSININADKALKFDAQLPQSLIAKALYFMNKAQYEDAVAYLEKALLYNPNSALVINSLADLYANYIPDKEKYLEYALMGIQLDIASHDSVTASYIYLHLSNSLIQSGFVKEADVYINKSLDYNPQNLYSVYVKAYIQYAAKQDLPLLRERLIASLNRDSTRLDILQEVGKVCYYMRDFESAYKYYERYIDLKEALNFEMYPGEDAKIGLVLAEVGQTEESDKLFEIYKLYADNDKSIYQHLSLAAYYSYKEDTKLAIEHLGLFSKEDNYQYWIPLFLKIDPLLDNIKDLPEFKKIAKDLDEKFWKSHEQIKVSLEEKELL